MEEERLRLPIAKSIRADTARGYSLATPNQCGLPLRDPCRVKSGMAHSWHEVFKPASLTKFVWVLMGRVRVFVGWRLLSVLVTVPLPVLTQRIVDDATGDGSNILSRGNYRKELFLQEGSGKRFEETLIEAVLHQKDSVAGVRKYQQHLEISEVGDASKARELSRRYSRGWFIGSREAKMEVARDLILEESEGPRDVMEPEIREAAWTRVLEAELVRRGKTQEAIQEAAKGAQWKAEIAWALRRQTTARNQWIAQELNMGHPSRVTNLIQGLRERRVGKG